MSRRNIASGARRYRQAVTRTEQQPYPTAAEPSWSRGFFPFVFARTSSDFAAMAGTTPGDGSVVLLKFDGTDLTDGTGTIDHVKNYAPKAISLGKKCWLLPWGGSMWIFSAEC
jgi:hypothetical protein